MAVLYILWLRQLKRYLRSRARIVASLAQPLLYLVVFGTGFGHMFQQSTGGVSYNQFLPPGIIAMAVLFTATFWGSKSSGTSSSVF